MLLVAEGVDVGVDASSEFLGSVYWDCCVSTKETWNRDAVGMAFSSLFSRDLFSRCRECMYWFLRIDYFRGRFSLLGSRF